MKRRRKFESLEDKFRWLCHIYETNECIVWPWPATDKGYSRFKWNKQVKLSHRVSLELHLGREILDGMFVDHVCRNRACVNPRHLREVTPGVNALENSVSPSAINAAATHCKSGHALTEENTYVFKNGKRRCRECGVRWAQEEYQRSKKKRDEKRINKSPEEKAAINEKARKVYAEKKAIERGMHGV